MQIFRPYINIFECSVFVICKEPINFFFFTICKDFPAFKLICSVAFGICNRFQLFMNMLVSP